MHINTFSKIAKVCSYMEKENNQMPQYPPEKEIPETQPPEVPPYREKDFPPPPSKPGNANATRLVSPNTNA